MTSWCDHKTTSITRGAEKSTGKRTKKITKEQKEKELYGYIYIYIYMYTYIYNTNVGVIKKQLMTLT